jgi:hypothetical protein
MSNITGGIQTEGVLRQFAPMRDEVTGGWRKYITKELHEFCSSLCIIQGSSQAGQNWQGM